jgi:hypothetical protein
MSAWSYWACSVFILTYNKNISHFFVCVSRLHLFALKVSILLSGSTACFTALPSFHEDLLSWVMSGKVFLPQLSLVTVSFLSFFILYICYI